MPRGRTMREMSTPAKSMLMAVATLMIGFTTLAAGRGNEVKSKVVARGDSSLAYSALTYVTWPKDSFEKDDSPFVFGVLGKPSEAHEKLLSPYRAGKKLIHGRTVEVRRFDDPKHLVSCHIVLIAQSCPPEQIEQALKLTRGKSVLTIGETGEFAGAGGVLGLVKSGDQSTLELNPQAAKRQKLKVDVRLVNLSVLVEDK